jgi:serine/threonine protein kinase
MERRLQDYYELGDVIGEGGFGSVCAGTCRHNGDTVAIKIIPKSKVFSWSKIGQQVVPKEVALLNCLRHKYVIKMLDYFQDEDNFYIVMERPEKYIDLFDYISEKRIMSERSARFLFRQVVEAVQYCLSVGVLHRDVKDENILINLRTSQIKLIDFGSGTFLRDDVYTEYEGTKVYAPPEWVLSHQYRALPATVWSLGILLYDMLLGDVPFETEAQIVAGYLDFHIQLSPGARSLIQWLLEFRPQDRPNLEQILKHPWLKKSSSSSSSPSYKTTTAASQRHKNLATPSSGGSVAPSPTKPTLSSSVARKETTISPSHRASGSGVANTTSSPSGASSFFTPPQGRTGIKYSVPPSPDAHGGGSCASSSTSPSPLLQKSGTLPPVFSRGGDRSTQHFYPSQLTRGSEKTSYQTRHKQSLTSSKTSKPGLRRLLSPSSRPTSQYGGGGGGVGTVEGVTGGRGGPGYGQPEAARTQLLVGRKQAF